MLVDGGAGSGPAGRKATPVRTLQSQSRLPSAPSTVRKVHAVSFLPGGYWVSLGDAPGLRVAGRWDFQQQQQLHGLGERQPSFSQGWRRAHCPNHWLPSTGQRLFTLSGENTMPGRAAVRGATAGFTSGKCRVHHHGSAGLCGGQTGESTGP